MPTASNDLARKSKPPRRFAEGYDPATRKTADENRAGRRAASRAQESEVRRFIKKLGEDDDDTPPVIRCQRCKTEDAFATYEAPRPPRKRARDGSDDDKPAVENTRESLVRVALRKCRHCGVDRNRVVRKRPLKAKPGGKRGRNSGKVSQHGKKG